MSARAAAGVMAVEMLEQLAPPERRRLGWGRPMAGSLAACLVKRGNDSMNYDFPKEIVRRKSHGGDVWRVRTMGKSMRRKSNNSGRIIRQCRLCVNFFDF